MSLTTVQTVHLIGGPLDGEDMDDVPAHCIEIYADTDHPAPRQPYRYNPYATALFGKTCFTHHTLSYDLHAR
jgi:hypothetical protein